MGWEDERGRGDLLGKMAGKKMAINQGSVESAKYDYRSVGQHLVGILKMAVTSG